MGDEFIPELLTKDDHDLGESILQYDEELLSDTVSSLSSLKDIAREVVFKKHNITGIDLDLCTEFIYRLLSLQLPNKTINTKIFESKPITKLMSKIANELKLSPVEVQNRIRKIFDESLIAVMNECKKVEAELDKLNISECVFSVSPDIEIHKIGKNKTIVSIFAPWLRKGPNAIRSHLWASNSSYSATDRLNVLHKHLYKMQNIGFALAKANPGVFEAKTPWHAEESARRGKPLRQSKLQRDAKLDSSVSRIITAGYKIRGRNTGLFKLEDFVNVRKSRKVKEIECAAGNRFSKFREQLLKKTKQGKFPVLLPKVKEIIDLLPKKYVSNKGKIRRASQMRVEKVINEGVYELFKGIIGKLHLGNNLKPKMKDGINVLSNAGIFVGRKKNLIRKIKSGRNFKLKLTKRKFKKILKIYRKRLLLNEIISTLAGNDWSVEEKAKKIAKILKTTGEKWTDRRISYVIPQLVRNRQAYDKPEEIETAKRVTKKVVEHMTSQDGEQRV